MANAARLRIEEEFSFAVRMEKIARIYENVIHGRKVKPEAAVCLPDQGVSALGMDLLLGKGFVTTRSE